MPSRPQFRAGREVAEDVKRAIRHAIQAAGLNVHRLRMILGEDQRARLVLGGGKPDGWPHELAPLYVEVLVTTSGDILPAKVFCVANDQDPRIGIAGGALRIKECWCKVGQLAQVVPGIWAERQQLMARLNAGEKIRSFTGRFEWHWHGIEDSVSEEREKEK